MVIDKESEPQPDTNTSDPVNGPAIKELIAKMTAWIMQHNQVRCV
jgi:hypothetical protein